MYIDHTNNRFKPGETRESVAKVAYDALDKLGRWTAEGRRLEFDAPGAHRNYLNDSASIDNVLRVLWSITNVGPYLPVVDESPERMRGILRGVGVDPAMFFGEFSVSDRSLGAAL